MSFDSGKLFDGYEDFENFQQNQRAKKAKEEALKQAGHLPSKPKKKSKKSKKPKRAGHVAFSTCSGSSASLGAEFDSELGKLIEGSSLREKEDTAEFDLNVSFSGGYVPNTDLTRVDKGQGNP
jgi:hypothetical protein